MSFEELAEKVVEYLRSNPYAKPSEIADYLGVSVKLVRRLLYRLRSRGLVARTDKGYVLKESASGGGDVRREAARGQETVLGRTERGVGERVGIEVLKKRVEDLEKRVSKLEDSLSRMSRLLVEFTSEDKRYGISIDDLAILLHSAVFLEKEVVERFLKAFGAELRELKKRGFVILGQFIVSRRGLEELRRSCPITNPELLPPRLKALLSLLVEEGLAYLSPEGELQLLEDVEQG